MVVNTKYYFSNFQELLNPLRTDVFLRNTLGTLFTQMHLFIISFREYEQKNS